MPVSSPFAPIDLPKGNILSYLFPPDCTPSTSPIWMDSKDTSISLSAAQLLEWLRRLALGLDNFGLKRGDVVMIYTPNHVFVPVAYLGIVGAGYSFSGANPLYTVPEMVHQISNTGAKVILVHPNMLATALAAAKEIGFPKANIFQFSDVENPPLSEVKDWRALLPSIEASTTYRWPELTPEESLKTIATINYSSGTTGLPKGVCITHSNLIANVEQAMFMKFHNTGYTRDSHPPERYIGFLPLYHAYGQLAAILLASKMNTPCYIMKAFVFPDFLQCIQEHKITDLPVAPPILVMLSKRPETKDYDLSSVRHIGCGAAPLSSSLQNEVSRRYNVEITQGWGMTEVTCGALGVPRGVNDDSGSVGVLNPNTEGMLVDEEGKEVGVGERGELWIRGPQVCLGYWKNEKATKESITSDRWLKTGDVAVRDERGWFWIVDRMKELIKVNGLQVAPAELEAVLLTHDDIADAAVVGLTLNNEEYPRAYVVLQASSQGKNINPEDIQNWIKTKVAKHKYLTGGVAFIDEVPKLASGKIMRKVMREWAKRDAEMLGRKPPGGVGRRSKL
ncbi:4-coumarate- ligase 2 protein [Rutstroemia sp. NJR-2017a WRK4]|nr:4-coumarate- ligase 2 protein [Rutstroemia sp. NJR-2017a WRK4]PQE11814.1 4-coumarate- ligase 2 protein [Rutstroemia sp. NJR-2017a WRK4]